MVPTATAGQRLPAPAHQPFAKPHGYDCAKENANAAGAYVTMHVDTGKVSA
jgi:hypothetical protein